MTRRAIVCHCRHAGLLHAPAVEAAMQTLHDAAIPITEMDDLCAAVERRDPCLHDFAGLIVACHPRAVRGLMTAAQVTGPVDIADARANRDPTAFAGQIRTTLNTWPSQSSAAKPRTSVRSAPRPTPDTPAEGWFPVIDYDRCANCLKCIAFCLFDVYRRDPAMPPTARRVLVDQPANCKPGCPACARVCPSQAIIFPKSPEEPISGGEGPISSHNIKVDLSAILGGDVYAELRQRSFDPHRNPTQAQADRERRLALLAAQRLLESEPDAPSDKKGHRK